MLTLSSKSKTVKNSKTKGYLEKLGDSSNVEVPLELYHRHIHNISESRSSLTGG